MTQTLDEKILKVIRRGTLNSGALALVFHDVPQADLVAALARLTNAGLVQFKSGKSQWVAL
jgi:hypothetical protein